MPEHLHLLTYPLEKEPDFARYLARIKQPFSKQVKEILVENRSSLLNQLTVRERKDKLCFRFWQEGPGFDRNIFSDEAITGSIDYIHENPVKRGLCTKAVEWKWSSARYYLSDSPREQELDVRHIHSLPLGALD